MCVDSLFLLVTHIMFLQTSKCEGQFKFSFRIRDVSILHHALIIIIMLFTFFQDYKCEQLLQNTFYFFPPLLACTLWGDLLLQF
jgi:hypothetical protein